MYRYLPALLVFAGSVSNAETEPVEHVLEGEELVSALAGGLEGHPQRNPTYFAKCRGTLATTGED